MKPLKIDHVTLLVSSLKESMPYYEALLPLLGFKQQALGIWHDEDGFYFQFQEAKPETSPYERYGAGMNHLGFGAPSVEFVEETRAKMMRKGFNVPDIQVLGGAQALFMKDPDGIRFEITYYPPGMPPVGVA